MRTLCAVLAGVLLTATAAQAGETGLAKTWRVTLFSGGQEMTFWLLKIDEKDGKVSGTLIPAEDFEAPSSLKDLQFKDKRLTFVLEINKQLFEFRALVPKAGEKTLFGSIDLGGKRIPLQLTETKEEKLSLKDSPPPGKMGWDTAKEIIAKTPENGRVFVAIDVLVRGAADKNIKADELRGWVQVALKQAARYGPEVQEDFSLHIADELANQKEFAPLALEMIRQINKDLTAGKAGAQARLRGLSALAKALKAAGKADEVAKVQQELEGLETVAHAEYEKTALGFEPAKFAGRKKGNRVVLVELFTGAQCPPCVAADLAFDGLERTFSHKEVVLLQYHLHIPGPDALTTPDSEARMDYYKGRGTPAIFFNGQSKAAGGGPKQLAEFKYNDYRKVIEPLLEEETALKLTASAVRNGDKIQIDAAVDGLAKPGDKVKLRLVLVEEWVRYLGGNGLPYHSRVVRALPGGAAGLALNKETAKHSATVELPALRKDLAKFLADDRLEDPTVYRKLSVVAFVQDDATREVLHAIEVPVKRE
jgi:hypothetical protein